MLWWNMYSIRILPQLRNIITTIILLSSFYANLTCLIVLNNYIAYGSYYRGEILYITVARNPSPYVYMYVCFPFSRML